MLSDDDIQRVAIQCGMKIGQHWNKGRMNTLKMRYFARAIEREARQQALEDAAQVCDSVDNYANPMTARDCADAIRALKERP